MNLCHMNFLYWVFGELDFFLVCRSFFVVMIYLPPQCRDIFIESPRGGFRDFGPFLTIFFFEKPFRVQRSRYLN